MRHTLGLPGNHGHIAGRILDRYDRFLLFGEHNSSIQEWRNNICDKKMNLGLSLLLKILIIIKLRNSTYKN